MRLSVIWISLAVFTVATQTRHPKVSNQPTFTASKPLILEKNEGEERVRRPRGQAVASHEFFIKVDRVNGGSQHMFAGAEEIPPGAAIPFHRHHGQDEILIIQTGSAHVWLGDQERDVHAGAMVFIPSNTWVSLKNIGSEPIRLAFVFSAPGFDDFMRCTSVPLGAPTPNLSPEGFVQCQHEGHAEFRPPAAPNK